MDYVNAYIAWLTHWPD